MDMLTKSERLIIIHGRSLGPLHMSLVDRAGQVSEISLYLWILCKIFDVFTWEGGLARFLTTRVFQPGYREKGWTFCHMNTGTKRDEFWRPRVCRSYDRFESYSFCVSPRLLCFLNFAPELAPGSLAFSHLGDRAKISHMKPKLNWSR